MEQEREAVGRMQQDLMNSLTDQSLRKDPKEIWQKNEKLENVLERIQEFYSGKRQNEIPDNRMSLQEIVENVRGRTIEETAVLQLKALYRSLFGKDKAQEAEKKISEQLAKEAVEAKKEGREIPDPDSKEQKEKEYSLFVSEIYESLAGPAPKTLQAKEQRKLESEVFKSDLKSLSKEAHEIYSEKDGDFSGIRMINYLGENPNALSDAFDRVLAMERKMAGMLIQKEQKHEEARTRGQEVSRNVEEQKTSPAVSTPVQTREKKASVLDEFKREEGIVSHGAAKPSKEASKEQQQQKTTKIVKDRELSM